MRVRTGYSFRRAVGSIGSVMDRIKELGWPAAPISDQGSTFGWVRWKKLAAKAGLRPIFGVEIGVTDSINSKRPTSDSWAFFAIDTVESINKLVEVSTNQFRYEALLTYDQANAAKGVLKIVGHRSDLSKIENDGRTYVALSPASMPGYIRQAVELGFPLIASSDNRYPTMDEEALYEVIVGGGNQTYSQTLLSIEEWREEVVGKTSLENIAAAERLLQETLERTEWATLQPATILAPERPASLREMCVVGAAKIGIDLSDPVYDARMTRELDLIKDKDFEDYFYIIADLVQWSRERMIVGPARGSSCGSLVCYLLGITTVDPIPYGLIFERFIDVNRNDLPDIDIDFSDQKRHLVFEYVAGKYGADRVARLGTVAMYQPRSAVAEAGAVLGVPKWKCEAALESLIERSSGDSRALNTLEDTLNTTPAGKTLLGDHPEIMIATKMEGHPRHAGQHAAGIVLTQEPVRNFVAVDSRTGATHCDKKDAEELNLLKIDALGLTQLSVFEDALELAGLDRLFLETLPMDDQAAFDVLNKKQYSGIFQFNGNSLQGLVDQIKVDHVEDIISITALARPGPLASGGANTWVKRKIGIEPITFPHPLFTPYLEMTKGVVLYQEQVMEIGRKIGDLTWEDVTALRKAMSKSLGKEYFDQFGDKFKAGALAKGIPLELTEKIWDDMCLSGDTELINPHPTSGVPRVIKLRDLYNRGGLVSRKSLNRQKLLMWDGESLKSFANYGVTYSGRKMTYTVTTESGSVIHATEDHKFLQPMGDYTQLKDLKPGDFLIGDAGPIPTPRKAKKGTGSGGHNWWHKLKKGEPIYSVNVEYLHKMFKNCQHCHKAPYEETHHTNMDHEDHRIDNLLPVCRKCHKKLHAAHSGYPTAWSKGHGIFNDPIVSIEPRFVEDVYDVHMPAPHHNFLASGIVVHNCAYGAWAFNRSHSVAYGIISYWCCWLKAHYPVEFAAATLSHEDDPAKQIQLLREMDHEGITYIPVDEELSIDKWTVGHLNGVKQLVGPVQNVKGIGPKLVQQIMSARARGEPLPPRASKLLSNPVTKIDSLWPIKDAFFKAMPNPRDKNIFTEPSNVADVRTNGSRQTVMVFAILTKIAPRDENEAVNVAKRGYAIKSGPLTSLNLWLADDTGTIYAKIDRFDFEEIGRSLVERGGVGKVLYAFKGEVPPDFRMIRIKQVRLIGYIDEKTAAILDQKERAPAPEAALVGDLAKQKAAEASEGLSE